MRDMILRCIKSYGMVKGRSREISFDPNSERLNQEYLDIFAGAKSDVIHTAKC